MNLINHSSKFFFAIFLMMNLSNTYAAKIQAVDAEVQESAVDAMEAAGAEAVEAG
ncbi:hypothetical protein J536_3884, partial [Acinetobacter sp. 809848]